MLLSSKNWEELWPISAERIRALRKEKGLSQERGQAASIGLKKYAVYSYEKGRACPDMRGLIALADYFNVSMDYLAGRTDNPDINR